MKLSIITVSLNSEKTIRDTINSVASQNYKNIEHVFVDGGSTDGTQNLESEFPDIIILNVGSDKWWTGATNEGIRYAQKNEFSSIVLLNDDLTIPENLLSVLIQNNKLYPYII